MPLENANFIANLNAAYPAGGDKKGQGDDHIRLLKAVLKSSFPNVDEAVQLSAAQLNAAAVDFASLNALFGSGEQAVSSTVFGTGMSAQRIRLGWHTPSGRMRALIGGSTIIGGFVVENDFAGGKQRKGIPGNQEFPGGFYIEMGKVSIHPWPGATTTETYASERKNVSFEKKFASPPIVLMQQNALSSGFSGNGVQPYYDYGPLDITANGFIAHAEGFFGQVTFSWVAIGFKV